MHLQDVAFQALQKDLETSFTELYKLVTENEAALQKHEHILVQQMQQLEGVADENCLDDTEKAFEEMLMSRARYLKPSVSLHWRK